MDEGVYTVCSVSLSRPKVLQCRKSIHRAWTPDLIKRHGTVAETLTCTVLAYYLCYAANTATTKNIGQTHSQNRRRFIAEAQSFDSRRGNLATKSNENVIYPPLPPSNLFHKRHSRQLVSEL